MSNNSMTATERILNSLWRNWCVSALVIIVVLTLPFIISKAILPFIVAGLGLVLLRISAEMSADTRRQCILFIRVTMNSLFITAAVMLVINLINWLPVFRYYIDMSNANTHEPYITCLVLFPSCAAVCAWTLLRGGKLGVCHMCRARNGYFPGNGFVATLFGRESRYQVSLMLSISLLLGAVEWWYYFVYYMNINLNKPDRFFFNVMPILLFGLSLYFIWMRYANMGAVIGPLNEHKKGGDSAVLRFLVFAGDHLMFKQQENGRWDIPMVLRVDKPGDLTAEEAHEEFARASGLTEFDQRYLYTNFTYDQESRVYHYAAFLQNREQADNSWLRGHWFAIDEVDRMIKSAALNIDLLDEIYRIHTITMAWKTYDRAGHRLYPIRHYVPTFRFRDLRDWDVDYDDTSWFTVARDNEDRRMFRLRRLFNRLMHPGRKSKC